MAMSTRVSFIKGDVMEVEFIVSLGMGGTKGIGLMGSMMDLGLRAGREGAGIEGSTGED